MPITYAFPFKVLCNDTVYGVFRSRGEAEEFAAAWRRYDVTKSYTVVDFDLRPVQ